MTPFPDARINARAMKLSDLLVTLDVIAPLRLAEKWDNVGLLPGAPPAAVGRCLPAIRHTPDGAAEARERTGEDPPPPVGAKTGDDDCC